jgi:signal transduction histidine kinase
VGGVSRAFRKITWVELGYLLLGGLTSWLAFAVLVAGTIVGGLLGVTLIGLPVLVAAFAVARATARVERERARLLGPPIPERWRRPARAGVRARLGAYAGDAQTWKDLGWLVLLMPIGFGFAVAAATLWAVVAWAVTTPLWWWAVPEGGQAQIAGSAWEVDRWSHALAVGAGGLVLLVAVPWICSGLARGQARLARACLTPSERAELRARVDELAESRAAAANAQTVELQRIERDLHDGAQAQLVALAIDLGLAQQKLEEDPEGARELLASAQEGAKSAIAELRELVRGVHPAVLTDRGLDGALAALAAKVPVPVELRLDVGPRLPAAAEAAAYFVVAEALTNVAKHSGATRASVVVRRAGDSLVVRVTDDGSGGADPAAGTGLRGLQGRLGAFDGTLRVTSPPGGPTELEAVIPCAP